MARLRIGKAAAVNICIAAALLIFISLVATKNISFGSAPGNWTYPYYRGITWAPILVSLAALPFIFALLLLTNRYIGGRERGFICLWLITGFFIQLTLRSVYPYSLATIIKSDVANSFYKPAMEYRADKLLRHYETIAPRMPRHVRSNMPGKIVFFSLMRALTASPRVMGWLVILISNIGALLTYALVKRIFHNAQTAIYSLILYLFIPAKIFFFPILNTVTPVFILLTLLLFLRYLESRGVAYLVLAGCSIYLVLFFEPLPLVMGIVCVALCAKYYFERKIQRPQLVGMIAYAALSFLALHLAVLLLLEFNIVEVFLMVLRDAIDFNLHDQRSYGIWVVQNPKDFFFSAGIAQMILFFFAMGGALARGISAVRNRVGRGGEIWKTLLEPGPLLTLSTAAMLLFLDLIGINRGEVARLWIFLAVLIQIVAAHCCAERLGRSTFSLVLVATMVQTTITLSMVGFVYP
ncbi:MAG: hypothetical protein NTX71_06300 [Candidatus Aureabacteria bacterium]|nr:hypothetical protein [Candidatus Auribacterota bacterium]